MKAYIRALLHPAGATSQDHNIDWLITNQVRHIRCNKSAAGEPGNADVFRRHALGNEVLYIMSKCSRVRDRVCPGRAGDRR